MEYITPSWNEIFEMCVDGAFKVIDLGIKFDLIATLSRGGLVPARIMSDLLEINDVIVLDVKYYTGIGKRSDRPIIREISKVLIDSKSVLLVDDVVDSGESLKAAVEYLKGLNPKCLKVFTLHVKPHRIIDPDIYVSETSAWIIYPWELFECYKELKANGVDVKKIFEDNKADTRLLDKVIQFYDKRYRG